MDQINFLPEHIMIDIFQNLSSKTIKQCSLVCKRWDEIISNSKVMMSRFQLYFNDKNAEEARNVDRKHRTIEIEHQIHYELDIWQHNIIELKLHNIRYTVDSWMFINMLMKLTQLKSLRAFIDITDHNVPNEKKAQLDLENLYCTNDVLLLLNVNSLKDLEVLCHKDLSSSDLFKLLKQQKKLDKLSLHGSYTKDLFQTSEMLELEFRLSEFIFGCDETFHRHEEFIKFLKIHQKSLKTLEIIFCGISYEKVKKYVLENMIDLKHILMAFFEWNKIIDVSRIEYLMALPLMPEALQDIFMEREQKPEINIAINPESLICQITNGTDYKKIFGSFKRVKKLTLNTPTIKKGLLKEILIYIGKKFKDLESLTIQEIGIAKMLFPNIKELKVENVLDIKIFNAFITYHSKTLEFVQFNAEENFGIWTVVALAKCKNLKSLVIFKHTENLLFYPIFNELSLSKGLTLDLIHCFYDSRMKFKFPDDKLFWDDSCKRFLGKMINVLTS